MKHRRVTGIALLGAVVVLLAACGAEPIPTPSVPGNGDRTATPAPSPTHTPAPPTATPTPTLTPYPSWIDGLIGQFESEPPANPPLSITEYRYDGRTVYFVPQRCCDIFSDLYDADGNLIAHPDGGITGEGDGRAPDFFENRTFVRTIWEDPRVEQDDRKLVLAPIESVEIAVLESFPVQYRAQVISGLPNGCAEFDHWEVEEDRTAREFRVQVFNSVPTDPTVFCTQEYRTVEHSIPLEGDIEPGATYTVYVNDTRAEFVAQ